MNIDRSAVFSALFSSLQQQITSATRAAENARQLATHEQSKPETQYDTVGLEASYLAHGQSQRAASLMDAVEDWKALQHKTFDNDAPIAAGALIQIDSSDSQTSYYLIGKYSGGLKLQIPGDGVSASQPGQTYNVTVVSLSSPIGKALKGKFEGDEIAHPVNKQIFLEIRSLY